MKVCFSHSLPTLCRSKIWIGIKVLQANSIILGTRKLWVIFRIKQKFDTMAAFLDNSNFSKLVKLGNVSNSVFSVKIGRKHCQKHSQNWQALNIFTIKLAAVLLNFCLIGKIRHNFLVPTMTETVCKTFMPIQTLVLHTAYYLLLHCT